MNDRPFFRLAFFSDPHLGPLPPAAWRLLANKRFTGWVNWRLSRRDRHDMKALDAIVADMLASKPDHILCGGDLANIGLPEEFAAADRFLRRLGDPADVSVVPGNHSAYIASSVAPMMAALAPWMRGDGAAAPSFPYLRVRGPIAIVGLNSAVATRPLDATGLLGQPQIDAARNLLESGALRGLCRVIVVHHPPHLGGAPRPRRLRDAAAFESMLRAAGAELVLHGHNHMRSLAWRPGPSGETPIVGVGSASEYFPPKGRKPVWLRIDIQRADERWSIAIEERGWTPGGAIETQEISLRR